MTEKYDIIFNGYKKFVEDESQYSVRVVKNNNKTSTYFPLVVCTLSNCVDTNYCTIDKIEEYEQYFFTINIFSKDKNKGGNIVSSQVIIDELIELTKNYFEKKLNMKRTLCKPVPNIDEDIYRVTMQYQCLIGNRCEIIRR